MIQDLITVGEPPRAVFNPTCCLHMDDEEEIPEVEIFCWILVPSVARGASTESSRPWELVRYWRSVSGVTSAEVG